MKIFSLIAYTYFIFFGTPKDNKKIGEPLNSDIERLTVQIQEVKEAISKDKTYNTKIAFLVDMKIKSGKNRFFVYDLENNKIIEEGLVANGSGSETNVRGDLKFSNEPNSKCTSLGCYAVGKSYRGMFGKSYKLYGLQATNSNAERRAIVLHPYSAVPNEEQDYYIYNSQGCPMVSEAFFKKLEKIIDSSKSKIILSIYY